MFKKSDAIYIYRGADAHPFVIDVKRYLYKFKRETKGNTTWCCNTTKECSGTIIECSKMIRYSTPHLVFCFPNENLNVDEQFRSYVTRLCEQKDRVLSNSEIYREAARIYPEASMLPGNSYIEFSPTIKRWKQPMQFPLPKSVLELDALLQNPDFYHIYGRNEFKAYEVNDEGYRFYDGLYTIQYLSDDGEVTSRIMAFKIHTVLAVVEGLCVQLAADGCQKILPRLYMTRKIAFDGIKQMYIVQIILNKKFYPFGFFLLQHATVEVFDKLFEIVHQWLATTTVFSLMTDYEDAPRTAFAKYYPEADEDGCGIHYIRAVGEYSIKKGIYADPLKKIARECATKAFALCYYPEEFVEHGINHIEKHAPVAGPSAKFCKGLISYLRTTWLPKKISVSNKEIRVNNGCEVFNWTMLRDSNTMQQNPFEFLRLLQKLNVKVSQQICQWRHTTITVKQMRVEDQHRRMLSNFKSHLVTDGLDRALSEFFEAAKYLTKSCAAVFQNAQSSNNTIKTINYGELWIQQSERTGTKNVKRSIGKTEKLKITLTPTDRSETKMTEKTVTVTNKEPLAVCRASRSIRSTYDNLYFDHPSISNQHAEFLYYNKTLYIRDLGQLNSIQVNGNKIGRVGVEWCPRQLQCGDTICLGLLEMVVKWDEAAAKTDSKENRGPTLTVRADISNTSQVPVRTLTFTEHVKLTIKKATKKEPAAVHNLNIKAAGLSFRSGNVALIDGYLYIYPLSNLVRTMVNGSRIISKTIVCSGDAVTFGSEKNPLPVTIRFTYKQTKKLNESIAIYPVGTVGTPFDRRVISFDENRRIVIGRGTDFNYHNGLFDAECLSSKHAYITHTPKGIFLKSQSKSGTYILKDDRSAKIERGRSVLIKAGDTIQFGSSKNSTTGFIRCAITIFDSSLLPKILTSVPPSTDQLTSSSSKQQSSSPLFDCTECRMRFSTKNFLQSHMDRMHTIVNTPVPPSTDQLTSSSSKQQSSSPLFDCTECRMRFSTKNFLQSHMDRMHTIVNTPVPPSTDQLTSSSSKQQSSSPLFDCTECRMRFSTKNFLQSHMDRMHTIVNTPVPPSTDQLTSSSSKQQSSSPLFDCTECRMRFSTKNFLQSHMDRMHKTISKMAYQCPDCSAKFTTTSLLLVHIENYHEGNSQRIFQCPLCDFKVKSDIYFCLHMNSKHTFGQPD